MESPHDNGMRGFFFVSVSLSIAAGFFQTPAGAATRRVEIYQTLSSSVALIPLKKQPSRSLRRGRDPAIGQAVFTLNPLRKFQRMDGFGAALTESCMMNVEKLSPEARADFLKNVFSKTDGAGFDLVRLPMGSTDFSDPSLPNFTYDDAPGPDPEFRFFDMQRAEPSFQLLREAQAVNPRLQVIVSPWSAPAWMKTSHDLKGGELEPAFAADFARYFVHTLHEMHRRQIPVTHLTIQNEPGYPNEWYPSMGMSVQAQISFIGNHLGPLLAAERLPVGILAHDHNWNMSQDTVLPILDDANARRYIGGVAYHCYDGWRWQMIDSMSRYPEIPTIQTECSGLLNTVPNENFHWWLQNQSLDAVNLGTTGALGWNLCLDQTGGPRNNGCEGCQGLITIDSSQEKPKVIYNPEFYALAQVSRFIRPGTHRISVEAQQPNENLQVIAFENSDGSLIFVAENTGNRPQNLQVRQIDGKSLDYELPGQAAVTMRWRPSPL